MISIIFSRRSNHSNFGGWDVFVNIVFFTIDLLGVPIEITLLSILQLHWEPPVKSLVKNTKIPKKSPHAMFERFDRREKIIEIISGFF